MITLRALKLSFSSLFWNLGYDRVCPALLEVLIAHARAGYYGGAASLLGDDCDEEREA
jgi:hypothetical protein